MQAHAPPLNVQPDFIASSPPPARKSFGLDVSHGLMAASATPPPLLIAVQAARLRVSDSDAATTAICLESCLPVPLDCLYVCMADCSHRRNLTGVFQKQSPYTPGLTPSLISFQSRTAQRYNRNRKIHQTAPQSHIVRPTACSDVRGADVQPPRTMCSPVAPDRLIFWATDATNHHLG